MLRRLVSLSIGGMMLAVSAFAEEWTVIDKIPIAGDDGWDYVTVEPNAQRLFVTHQDRVAVIDLATKKEIGSLPGQRVHGVALAPDLERGFFSDGDVGRVTVFNLKTLQVMGTILAAPDTDAICYDPTTKRVFTFNGDSGNATVIDATQVKAKAVATIDLGGKPEYAQSDGKGIIYANIEDKDEVIQIDAATARILERWKLPVGSKPCSMGIDRESGHLFIGCRNKTLLVVDAKNGEVISTLPIGAGVDATIWNPATKEVFSSCGDGTIAVIQQKESDVYALVTTIQTPLRSHTLGFDPKSRLLYVPSARFGPIPAATSELPHPRPPVIPATFEVLVFQEK